MKRRAFVTVLAVLAAGAAIIPVRASAQYQAGAAWPTYGADARHAGMAAIMPGTPIDPSSVQYLSVPITPIGGKVSIDNNHNVYASFYNTPNFDPSYPDPSNPAQTLTGLTALYLYSDPVSGYKTIRLRWCSTVRMTGQRGPSIGPDGTLYGASANTNQLYAVRSDGTPLWSFNTAAPPLSGVTIGPNPDAGITLYVGEQNDGSRCYLYALTANGALRWRYQAGDSIYTPVVSPDGATVYFGCKDGYTYALGTNATSAKLKWKMKLGASVCSSPAIDAAGSIYVASQGGNNQRGTIHKLSPSGATLWSRLVSTNTQSSILSAPALDEQSPVAAAFGAGIAYVGAGDGLYALRMDTGAVLRKVQQNLSSTGGHAAVDNRDGLVYLAGRSPDGFQILDLTKPAGSEVVYRCADAPGTDLIHSTHDFLAGAPAVDTDGTIWLFGYEATPLYAFMRPSLP